MMCSAVRIAVLLIQQAGKIQNNLKHCGLWTLKFLSAGMPSVPRRPSS